MGDIRSTSAVSTQTNYNPYTVTGNTNQSLGSPDGYLPEDGSYQRYLALCRLSPLLCFLASCTGYKPSGSPDTSDCTEPDQDGDGYDSLECGGEDCDDNDPTIHPDADEIRSDGIDQNCNGMNDEDMDADGYSVEEGDNLDDDDSINPGADEIRSDGIDQNCNGMDDEDVDGDGYTVNEGDCDDNDITSFPGNTEAQDNGVDNDCSGDLDGGGTVNCGGEYTTIQASVNYSQSGDTINICAGTYAEAVDADGLDLTFRRTGDGDVIVTGNGTDRAFTFNDGTYIIKNINIIGSHSDSNGGGILVKSGAELTINSCNISYNSSDGKGGAIAVSGGALLVEGGTTISYNTISSDDGADGAGIYTSGNVEIAPSGGDITMAGNEGTFAVVGGSLYINEESGSFYLTDSMALIWNVYIGRDSNFFAYEASVGDEYNIAMDGSDSAAEYSLAASGNIVMSSAPGTAWYDSTSTRAICSYDSATCEIF